MPDPIAIELGKIPNDEWRSSNRFGFNFFFDWFAAAFLSISSDEL
jgi:hypothetical protein